MDNSMQAQKSKATNDPWAAMDALLEKEQGPTGPEWFTIQEWAERYQRKNAKKFLRNLYNQGKLERWFGSRVNETGRIVKYRVKT